MIRTLILAALLALAQPALAADCYTPEKLVKDATEAGAIVVATLHWTADRSDTGVVVQYPRILVVWGFKNGCVVGSTPLDSVTPKNKGTPA